MFFCRKQCLGGSGKASDAGSGALTVMLGAEGFSTIFLQQQEKVMEKGRWETKTRSFTAI
jgi:hypothetical protein